MNLKQATCAGQRDAIRSLYLTPPRSNVVVLLPTGAGKSAAFQFAALHNAATGDGMVVVVVPTTALARDQESRYRELARRTNQNLPVGVPLAFHSGLSDLERATLRRAVADGELPILFASPESLLGSLQQPLISAAEKGFVSVFAVDEAHIVAGWAEFRPEFQAISGFRDALAARCPVGRPFRTVLLTATLTAEGFDILTGVFGRLQVVAELTLRTEPGYLISMCADDAEKRRRIEAALYHLPRPLILYTTLRKDAEEWHLRMTEHLGFRRVRCVRGGDMANAEGAETLRAWTAGDLDVVVATSAFGMGVDQSEVRSVIHGCVPENIDRWYQEVGRAGRDGRASVALLIGDADDWKTAERMARETLLGPEKAWARWNAMRKAPRPSEVGGDDENARDSITVPLNTLTTGNDVATLHDEDWNFRTLTMMVHAGMLRFSHALPRSAASITANDGEEESRSSTPSTPYAHVTIIHTDHLDEQHFSKRFSEARARRIEADRHDLARLRALIDGTRSVHELLRETYAIPTAKVIVPATPGDCPKSRRDGRARHDAGQPILVRPSDSVSADVVGPLRQVFQELHREYHGPLLLRYEPTASWSFAEDMRELTQRLAALGVIEFAWPAALPPLDWADLGLRGPKHYVFAAEEEDDPAVRPWQVPRVTALHAPRPIDVRRTLAVIRPRHIVLVPTGLDDPHTPHRSFNSRTHFDLPSFLERIRPR